VRYQQADTRIASAEQQADAERVRLILEVSEQYLACLYAGAVARHARAELAALEGLLAAVTRGFAAGANTRTDILDAEARQDAARVKLIEAEQSIDAALRAIESTTGRKVSAIHPIQPERLVLDGPAKRIREWQQEALAGNPEIRAARFNLRLAKQDIQLQQAGHHPSLDLIAQRQFAESDTITALGSRTTTNLWGLQFDLPIVSGGFATASTQQAHARLQRAQAELDAKIEEIMLSTARNVEALHASHQRVRALERAETSATAALAGTEKGVQAGTRSFVDVLNARQQLFEVLQSKARAEVDFVLNLLTLKASAGLPDETAVEEANALLSGEASVSFADISR